MPTPLERFARTVIGPSTVLSRPRTTGPCRVVELRDADGERWFAKRLHLPHQWAGELRGLTWWGELSVDLLRRTPEVRAVNPQLRAMVTRALPGDTADETGPAVYAEAGSLLRVMHAARPPDRDGGAWLDATRENARFETDRCRTRGLRVPHRLVRRALAGLAEIGDTPVVPTHGDFAPHNWMSHPQGGLQTLDFAEAALRPAARDITRVVFGPTWGKPELFEAFCRGYGRDLLAEEEHFVRHHLALTAVTAVGWGSVHDHTTVRDRGFEVLDTLRRVERPWRWRSRRRPWAC